MLSRTCRIEPRVVVLAVCVVLMAASSSAVANDVFPQSVASGDPRPDSVVLWTRLVSPLEVTPKTVTVEVARDVALSDVVYAREVMVDEDRYDGVVKLLVDGLEPYTTYYYQFSHGQWASPVGRTRTAPTPDMDVPVRIAVVYCQDYVGRWFNAYLKLLRDHDEQIDFVVHLGDYIYETTGDPSFQDPTQERQIEFADVAGAIPLGGDNLAAASLANYRTLYRTYRSDEVLQQVHERWPMIVTWDDHEFSNDAWQANATYLNGLADEHDEARKRAAEQAFFEWVPIEIGLGGDGTLDIEGSVLFPNSSVHRDFQYGKNMHLVLTDTRTNRPDHLIPEDAFPGAIAVDQEALEQMLGPAVFAAVKGSFDPYVDFDALADAFPIFRQSVTLLVAGAINAEVPDMAPTEALARAGGLLHGNLSLTLLDELFGAIGVASPFPQEYVDALPRGVSFLFMGKTGFFSSTGSRLAVLHDTFNLYAGWRYLMTAGAAQEIYGDQQDAWLQGVLLQSQATWKVLANSVMMTPLVVDFTNPQIEPMLPPGFPDLLRTRLDINVEDFNGFPQKRQAVLGLLDLVPNAVVISGDIHATFITDHGDGTYEFTGPAVSSSTQQEQVLRFLGSDPFFGSIPGLDQLVAQIGLLLQVSSLDDVNVSPSDIVFADTSSHGFMLMTAAADELRVTLELVSDSEVGTRYYDDPEALDDLFTTVRFSLTDGQLTPIP